MLAEKEAAEVLASPDAAEKVAAALALVAGKSEIAQRSLLTGEDNMKTVLLEATDNSALSPADDFAPSLKMSKNAFELLFFA